MPAQLVDSQTEFGYVERLLSGVEHAWANAGFGSVVTIQFFRTAFENPHPHNYDPQEPDFQPKRTPAR